MIQLLSVIPECHIALKDYCINGLITWACILGDFHGFVDRQEYASVFFGGVCRICFGSNWIDNICSIHRYREKHEEPFEMDTETDFNNNRRNSFANSDYGSEGGWNAYIPLAKTCLVDLMSPQECRV